MIYTETKVLQSISRSKTYPRLSRSKFELQRSRYFGRLFCLHTRFCFVTGLITYFFNLSSCEVEGSSVNMIVFGKIF